MISKRKIWLLVAGTVTAVVVTLASVVLYQWKMPHVRAWLIKTLSEQLDSNVEIGEIGVVIGPTVQVTVHDIVIRHRLYPDAPPLIRAETFTMEASLLAVLRKPRRIASIEVTRLHIFIPPRRKDDAGEDAASTLAAKLRGPSPVVVGPDHHRRHAARDRFQEARTRSATIRDPQAHAHRRCLRSVRRSTRPR